MLYNIFVISLQSNNKTFFVMKISELLKILKKDGWYLYRNGGRHDIYRHPTKPNQLTIPRHGSKEVAKGTEQRILKDAGLK